MITLQERDELVGLSRQDGRRFYQVVEGIDKFLIRANWVVGIVGTLLGLAIIFQPIVGQWGRYPAIHLIGGSICLVLTSMCRAGLYVFAVLTTHGAKVLVHILFSNLAIMEGKQS